MLSIATDRFLLHAASPILAVTLAALQSPGAGLRHVDPSRTIGTSKAVVVGGLPLAHTALILPVDSEGRVVGRGSAPLQVNQVLVNLSKVLEAAGTDFENLVRLHAFVARDEVVSEVERALVRWLSGKPGPAVTYAEGVLAHSEALVALEAVAAVPAGEEPSRVKRIIVPTLHLPIGTCHVAVLPPGRKVYVAGRAAPGNLEEAVRGTLEQLRGDLEEVGLSHSDVVQLKVFLNPIDRVAEVEGIIADYYGTGTPPAVAVVEWFGSSLPVEIEAVAAGGPALPAAERVEYFAPTARFSRIARVNHGDLIFVSGLYGKTAGEAGPQIHEILAELEEILEKTGSDLRYLVKATYYPSDDEADRKLNEIRPDYYDPRRSPSASKIRVRSVAREGKSITFDMIAVPTP